MKKLLSLIAVFFNAAVAHAQCQCGGIPTCAAIQVFYDNMDCSSWSCFSDPNGGYRIIFNSANVCPGATGGIIRIFPAASGVVINSITISSATNAPSNRSVAVNILQSPNGWFQSVGSITSSGNLAVYAGEIQVPLGSINGSWTLHSINNVDAGGDISANFVSTGSTGTGAAGDIARIRSTGGNITGNITANRLIDHIEAAGTVGTSGSLVSINSKNELRRLLGSAIYANINTRNAGGSGDLWYVTTTNGPLVGSINTTNIQAPTGVTLRGLDIAGNLGAVITCTGQINEAIAIDGAVLSGGHINTGANGITKQIILNQDNSTYLWLDTATVGTSTLSPVPYYDNAPSVLGGGAIGLAPFMVHYEACNPVAAGDPLTTLAACTAHATSPPLAKVSITHYGPVGLWDGTTTGGIKNILSTNPPSGIEGFRVWVADDTNCNWVEVTDSFTTKYVGGNNRTFDIEGPFSPGPCFVNKYYRIKPVQEYVAGNRYPLVCRDVDGNPVAGDYEYIVKIEPPDCGGWGGN